MAKSKSAYSVSTKKEKSDTHIFVLWVANEAGVLARVVGLFSGRGYNIESLAVAEIDATRRVPRLAMAGDHRPNRLSRRGPQPNQALVEHAADGYPLCDSRTYPWREPE